MAPAAQPMPAALLLRATSSLLPLPGFLLSQGEPTSWAGSLPVLSNANAPPVLPAPLLPPGSPGPLTRLKAVSGQPGWELLQEGSLTSPARTVNMLEARPST